MNTLTDHCKYIFEFYPNGMLIKAPPGQRGIPSEALMHASNIMPKNSVLDPGVAGALKAFAAVGEPQNMAGWRKSITQILADTEMPAPWQWIRGVDCGLSSMVLFLRLCPTHSLKDDARRRLGDAPNDPTDTPHDAGDFGRCLRMIEFCGWQDRVKEARDISPEWSAIIDRWDSLVELYKRGELNAIQFP
jgi:hypothetical protein